MPQVAEFDGIEYGHLYYGLRIENAINQGVFQDLRFIPEKLKKSEWVE